MFRLSEHLYPLDEVIASLIQSIISKKPIDECLFWLWELETSINTIADGITCIYNLFYESIGKEISNACIKKNYCIFQAMIEILLNGLMLMILKLCVHNHI